MSKVKSFLSLLLLDYTHSTAARNHNSEVSLLELKSEVVSLIYSLEKCLLLGLLQCLNSLLFTLFILPIKSFFHPCKVNILRTLLLISISLQVSHMMSVSRLYHDLKEQDFLKLNFVYNLIGVADQLLMAYGQKCMMYFATSIENFIFTAIYIWLHTMHLSLAITVFEVALSSSRYNLLLVVMTSAFVEIKITVFKKQDRKGLLNVIYNDIVERLQIILYVFTIYTRAVISRRNNIEEISEGILIIIVTSFLIDWVKHYFIIHFNGFSSSIYIQVYNTMKDNWKQVYEKGSFVIDDKTVQIALDPSCSLTVSYKFIALPHACMVIPT